MHKIFFSLFQTNWLRNTINANMATFRFSYKNQQLNGKLTFCEMSMVNIFHIQLSKFK